MDGLLDGPSRSSASKALLSKLSGRLSFLAAERVGHHTVIKLFKALPMEEKAVLSAELSQSLNRLGSNAMGRSVMVSCAVKEYLEGEEVWKSAVTKQEAHDNWLKDIVGENDKDITKSKKERKRKRHD
jgi:pectin methylesterase-like acyl-CoA thioesterase